MRTYSIIAFTFILTSCNYFEAPSKWTTTKDPEEFKPTVLNLDDFQINGNSVILSRDELLSKFGQPDTITGGGGYWPEEVRKSKEYYDSTLIRYESWHYNQFKFVVWKNLAQLKFIDFRNKDII